MIRRIKKFLYFPVAWYFRLFASIQLYLWRPRIIVITGSSGKTTLLHLVEAQLGSEARYSHHANSTFGIPFDILGLKRTTLFKAEWLYLFLAAPFKAFKKPYAEKIYIVEADCDRPGEGNFLSSLLKPEVLLWGSCSQTHSAQFESEANEGTATGLQESIAYEFGYFLAQTKKLAVLNADNSWIQGQAKRATAQVSFIQKANRFGGYRIFSNATEFIIDGQTYRLGCLLPEEVFYSLCLAIDVCNYLEKNIDPTFAGFVLPPGRSSVFSGVRDSVIIDSSYNATFDGLTAVLHMFSQYPASVKWVVVGDMLEQGREEQIEHEKLASKIASFTSAKILLVGTRVCKYTYPKLKELLPSASIECFASQALLLKYLQEQIRGGETLLFKGIFEGVIEHLLADKKDVEKLCRREKVWQLRRKKLGL